MQTPLLSICLPTYNRADRLQECINYILRYPGDEIELVISDNGSLDRTEAVVNSIQDRRVKYYRNECNEGFVRNCVKVLERASANVVLFMSDEDRLNIEALPKIIALIKKDPKLSVIIGCEISKTGFQMIARKDDEIRDANEAFFKYGFTNGYLSGTIINKKHLSLRDINNELEKENNGLLTVYPHVYMHVVCLLSGGTLHTISDIVYFQGSLAKSFMDDVSGRHYTDPESRFSFFKANWDITLKHCSDTETIEKMLVRLFDVFSGNLRGVLSIITSNEMSKYWGMYSDKDFNFIESLSLYHERSIGYLSDFIDSESLEKLDKVFGDRVKEAQERVDRTLELSTRLKLNPNLLLFGAGIAGGHALRILNDRKNKLSILAFVDNDRSKWGTAIHGVPVISMEEVSQMDRSATILIAVEDGAAALSIQSQLARSGSENPIYWHGQIYIDILDV